jgi:hypothetical protein
MITDEKPPAAVIQSNHNCPDCGGTMNVVLGSTPYWVHADPYAAVACYK